VTSRPPPWAKNYRDDPVTGHLLARGVSIAYHEDLHKAAKGFLDPPFRQSLGKANTEALGMYHYTVHVKLGIALEYLEELKSKLNSHSFNLLVDPSFTFHKLLSGFFTNLISCYDNLAHEVALIYDLRLDEKGNFNDIIGTVLRSAKKVQDSRALPSDTRAASFAPLLQNAQAKIDEITRYRNHLVHRKLVNTMTTVAATAPGMPSKWYQMQSIPLPTQQSFPLPSGAYVSVAPSGSGISNQSGQQISVNLPVFTTTQPARFYLPKSDKLDLLPTELNWPNDLDDRDITVVCDDFYGWTVDFLGRVYNVLLNEFSRLP
jgi:hypothetical protein